MLKDLNQIRARRREPHHFPGLWVRDGVCLAASAEGLARPVTARRLACWRDSCGPAASDHAPAGAASVLNCSFEKKKKERERERERERE